MTTSDIQTQITNAALQQGVPPSLALAVAQQESSFNPNAVSKPNSNGTVDYGLFQINSSNLASFGVTNPLDPTQNINAGVAYLGQLLTQYNGDQSKALAAYNAGPGAVASGNIPSSTQSYVAAVLANQGQFSTVLPADLTQSGDTTDTTDQTDSSSDLASIFAQTVSIGGLTVSTPVAFLGVGFGIFLLAKLFGD
jgi:transglycosylase-like protein with SLT domain